MIVKKFLAIALCVIGVTSTGHAEPRALLVGIDDYQYLNPLVGSKQDVENMTKFIQSQWGYQSSQIRTLTDEQATRAAILAAFDDWLIRGSQAGDKVLFYYSGHGYFLTDDDSDERDGYDEALCPVDAGQALDGRKINMIRDDEINRRLKQLTGRQVTVIADACHSGSLTKNPFDQGIPDVTVKTPFFKGQPPRQMEKSLQRNVILVELLPNVVAYSAVNAYQQALVDTSQFPPAGVFTRRFIDGLTDNKADDNQDGKVSHKELRNYTRRQSEAYCKARPYNCQQGLTPQLEIGFDRLNQEVRHWAAISDSKPLLIRPKSSTPPPVVDELQVEIFPRTPRTGQKMHFLVHSQNRNGYLLLFDASQNGGNSLKRLFPNEHTGDIFIKAKKPRKIPDQLSHCEIVARSSGKRLLVGLLVNDVHDLSTLQNALPEVFVQLSSKYQRGLSRVQTLSQQLSQQLNQALLQKNVRVDWSLVTVDYQIID